MLFLTAGNIHRAFGTKQTEHVRGAARVLPVSGPVFLAAFLAITGSPPFAPFFSEFAILAGAVQDGAFLPAAAFLLGLSVIFIGMGATVLGVVQGAPPEGLERPRFGDSLLTAGPPLALMAAVLALGLWVPAPLRAAFEAAAASWRVSERDRPGPADPDRAQRAGGRRAGRPAPAPRRLPAGRRRRAHGEARASSPGSDSQRPPARGRRS